MKILCLKCRALKKAGKPLPRECSKCGYWIVEVSVKRGIIGERYV